MSGIYVREPTETSKAPELYVTPAVTEQQYQQLLEDMRVLYQGHSRKNGWEGPSTFQQAPAAHDLRPGSAGAASAHATAGIAAAAQSAAHQHQYTWPVSVWAEGRGDMQASMFSVTAHDSMTVRLLKRELLQQGVGRSSNGGSGSEGRQTSPSQLRIFQYLTELQDHMLVPDSPGAILRVMLPGQEPPSKKPTYTVKVKMLSGSQCDITECGPWSFVWEFRSAVASRIDTTPENIRLIFAGKQLEDGVRLDEYNVQDGSAINCVLRSVTQ